jgi:outer membrane protein assembly factor BamD
MFKVFSGSTSIVLACLVGWLGHPAVAQDPFQQRFPDTELSAEESDAPSAQALLQKAEGHEAGGDSNRALGTYRALVKRFPDSQPASKAQFKVGQIQEAGGEFNTAFDAYTTYITKYPKGEQFAAAVESQFQIAKLFLEGEKTKLLGVKTFPSMARAQEMFESIVKNAPYSKEAAPAQFYLGQALEKQDKFPEALAAYEAVLAKHPGDPIAADAQYQIGYVHLRQSRGGMYDPNVARGAREAFEDFVSRYPNHEKVAQAKENIASLAGGQTKGSIEIAQFYDKQKNYKAAAIYYNEVIRIEAGSEDAKIAQQRIDELRETVGEEALQAGPEKAETGPRAKARRRMQAQVDTAARPDYNGPKIVVPDELPPPEPDTRTSPDGIDPVVPAVEPELPSQ